MAMLKTTTLDGLLALLANKDRAKLGNNTEAVRYADGGIGVFLYDTTVVIFQWDGRVTLHDGGWRTATTKDRMNQFLLPLDKGIAQRKGEWYLIDNLRGVRTERLYYNGMEV